MSETEITLEANDRVLRLGDEVVIAGQVKHIIVNHDTNPNDRALGSVVIETIPLSPTGAFDTTPHANQVQLDFSHNQAFGYLQQFSTANNISMTNTNLENARFHETFWAE